MVGGQARGVPAQQPRGHHLEHAHGQAPQAQRAPADPRAHIQVDATSTSGRGVLMPSCIGVLRRRSTKAVVRRQGKGPRVVDLSAHPQPPLVACPTTMAELPNLMPPRSSCLPIDTKHSGENTKLLGFIGRTPGENPKIYIFAIRITNESIKLTSFLTISYITFHATLEYNIYCYNNRM